MGAFLDKPKVEKRTNSGVGNGLRFATSAMQGWRVEMEDADVAIVGLPNGLDSWSFFGVFDGHAGAYVSKYCAEHLLEAIVSNDNFTKAVKLLDAVQQNSANSYQEYTDLAKEAVKMSFIQLDKNIRNIIEEGEKSGSTAVVVLVSSTHVYFGNCGDSRGIFCRNGKQVFATSDHKPVNPEEKSRIEKAGGSVMIQRINGSLAVSRALGDFEYKMEPELSATEQLVSPEPEVSCLKRESDDEFLLLACDGVWDVMSNEEVIGFIRAKMMISDDLVYVCNELMDTCLAKVSTQRYLFVVSLEYLNEQKQRDNLRLGPRLASVERPFDLFRFAISFKGPRWPSRAISPKINATFYSLKSPRGCVLCSCECHRFVLAGIM